MESLQALCKAKPLEPRLPFSECLKSVPHQSLESMRLRTPEIFREKVVIGEGTFGKVYKAKIGDKLFALKKIKMEHSKEGFPITSIREIKVLNKLHSHPNIVHLEEIVRSKGQSVYLVFEFVEFDLHEVIKRPIVVFTKLQLKYLLK